MTVTGCSPQRQSPPDPDDTSTEKNEFHPYECFLYDYCMCDHPLNLEFDSRIFLENPDVDDILKGSTRTIKFYNIQITGTYISSVPHRNGAIYHYGNKNEAAFSINSYTGTLQTIDLTDAEEFISTEIASEISDIGEEEAKKVADIYASELINPSDYSVAISSQNISRSFNDVRKDIKLYCFQYEKYYNGILTSDRITVKISSTGNFAYLFSDSPNSYESLLTDNFDIDKLHHAVDDKMNSMLDGITLLDFTYTINDVRIFKYLEHIWLESEVYYFYSRSDGDTAKHLLTFYVVVK